MEKLKNSFCVVFKSFEVKLSTVSKKANLNASLFSLKKSLCKKASHFCNMKYILYNSTIFGLSFKNDIISSNSLSSSISFNNLA